MFRPRNILVPTDFSAGASAALNEAVTIAAKFNSKIFLLHVVDEEILQCGGDYCLGADEVRRLRETQVDQAMHRLRKMIKKTAAGKKLTIMPEVRVGDPSAEILQEEKEHGIDLVVTAAGEKKWPRGLLGRGLPEKIMRKGPAEVLVVH